MASAPTLLIALLLLAPATALAHGTHGSPIDPPLHVDPTLEDCSVIFSADLTQDAFRRFTREFGSVSAFKPGATAAPLGRRGVTFGIEQLSFPVEDHSDAWNDTFAHPDAEHELGDSQSFPLARARVGVTDRFDLGAFWTRNFNANYGWLGLEARYAFANSGGESPVNFAARAAYTKTLYVNDMDMHAITAEVAGSRTLWNRLTPYLYLGGDVVIARERSDVVALHAETQVVPHVVGGAELNLWHMMLGGEVSVSALTSYQLRVAAAF
ncbi:MAG TPA: hypothetical protein VN896_08860 [Methylomirabilota bacterium]|jgi:hypothetical protein|nr:hypothetical protein [Methylomirabilota bacterium]